MKIIVTVKQVPDTSGKVAVNPDGTLDRASMQTIINPDDMNAVEAALALKDELGCKDARSRVPSGFTATLPEVSGTCFTVTITFILPYTSSIT